LVRREKGEGRWRGERGEGREGGEKRGDEKTCILVTFLWVLAW